MRARLVLQGPSIQRSPVPNGKYLSYPVQISHNPILKGNSTSRRLSSGVVLAPLTTSTIRWCRSTGESSHRVVPVEHRSFFNIYSLSCHSSSIILFKKKGRTGGRSLLTKSATHWHRVEGKLPTTRATNGQAQKIPCRPPQVNHKA